MTSTNAMSIIVRSVMYFDIVPKQYRGFWFAHNFDVVESPKYIDVCVWCVRLQVYFKTL